MEEQAKVNVEIVPSCFRIEMSEVEPDGHSTLAELKVARAPCTDKSSKELVHMDADDPLERASTSPWGEFLDELALTIPQSYGHSSNHENIILFLWLGKRQMKFPNLDGININN
jgi:hypothetical protein